MHRQQNGNRSMLLIRFPLERLDGNAGILEPVVDGRTAASADAHEFGDGADLSRLILFDKFLPIYVQSREKAI